jgi:hypothetical protein
MLLEVMLEDGNHLLEVTKGCWKETAGNLVIKLVRTLVFPFSSFRHRVL